MDTVTIRDLRNHGGEVVDRVLKGEVLVITRAGRPVAELKPLQRDAIDSATLLARWKHLPIVDPAQLRADVDALVDQRL